MKLTKTQAQLLRDLLRDTRTRSFAYDFEWKASMMPSFRVLERLQFVTITPSPVKANRFELRLTAAGFDAAVSLSK